MYDRQRRLHRHRSRAPSGTVLDINLAISHLTKGIGLLEQLPNGGERDLHELYLRSAFGIAYIATKGYSAPEDYFSTLALGRNLVSIGNRERVLYLPSYEVGTALVK